MLDRTFEGGSMKRVIFAASVATVVASMAIVGCGRSEDRSSQGLARSVSMEGGTFELAQYAIDGGGYGQPNPMPGTPIAPSPTNPMPPTPSPSPTTPAPAPTTPTPTPTSGAPGSR
jgi:hypothetical protein